MISLPGELQKTRSAGQALSGEQLRDVAETLGEKWEQAALHLGLKKEDLDDIKKEEKAESMQRRNMLLLWKRRRPGEATAQDLLRGLEDMEDLPVETRQLLKVIEGNILNPQTQGRHSGGKAGLGIGM